MTALVFGIGIGLFAVLLLWVAAALIFAVSLRTEKKLGATAIAVAVIVTIILVGAPRGPEEPVSREDKPYDRLFVWRIVLLVLLAISAIIGFIGYVKYELLETVKPARITNWIYD